MKAKFEKRIWMEAKYKLMSLYNCLAESDFTYEPGKEQRMLERIRTKIHLSQQEFYSMIGLRKENRHSMEVTT